MCEPMREPVLQYRWRRGGHDEHDELGAVHEQLVDYLRRSFHATDCEELLEDAAAIPCMASWELAATSSMMKGASLDAALLLHLARADAVDEAADLHHPNEARLVLVDK